MLIGLVTDHVPKEIRKFMGNKIIKVNLFRIQAYNSVMSGYFCIGFIGFRLKQDQQILPTYFSKQLKKIDAIILEYSQ